MCGNYSREKTIQGRKLYEEIRYIHFHHCTVFLVCVVLVRLLSFYFGSRAVGRSENPGVPVVIRPWHTRHTQGRQACRGSKWQDFWPKMNIFQENCSILWVKNIPQNVPKSDFQSESYLSKTNGFFSFKRISIFYKIFFTKHFFITLIFRHISSKVMPNFCRL